MRYPPFKNAHIVVDATFWPYPGWSKSFTLYWADQLYTLYEATIPASERRWSQKMEIQAAQFALYVIRFTLLQLRSQQTKAFSIIVENRIMWKLWWEINIRRTARGSVGFSIYARINRDEMYERWDCVRIMVDGKFRANYTARIISTDGWIILWQVEENCTAPSNWFSLSKLQNTNVGFTVLWRAPLTSQASLLIVRSYNNNLN